MNRPESVSEPLWDTFIRLYNAAPASRRSTDVPMDTAQVQAAINRMVDATIEDLRGGNLAGGERGEIFKASEAPEFTDLHKFPSYYAQLRFFMRGQSVSSNRCVQACFLIMSRWTGKQLMDLAQETDASTLARPTWEATQTHLLEWLNGKFRSKTDFGDAVSRWLAAPEKLRGRKFKSGQEFYLAFETELAQFNAACNREGETRPSNQEITRHFVTALPPAIAARVRESANDLDTVEYERYRTKIANVWAAHLEANIKINRVATKRARTPDEDEEEAVAYAVRQGQRRWAQKGQCRDSWEAAPKELHGQIYWSEWMSPSEESAALARWKRVKNAKVCARCRKPRGNSHLEDTFQPVGSFKDEARAREIVIAEPEQEVFEDAREEQ